MNVNRYICAFQGCQKSFSRASRLDLHIKSAHSGHNLFECDYPNCGKIFAEKGNLQVHLRTHTGEKPYGCLHCSKRFTTIGNCKDHERRHNNDKPYACKLCSVKYYRKYQLVKHYSSKHHEVRPQDIEKIEGADDESFDSFKKKKATKQAKRRCDSSDDENDLEDDDALLYNNRVTINQNKRAIQASNSPNKRRKMIERKKPSVRNFTSLAEEPKSREISPIKNIEFQTPLKPSNNLLFNRFTNSTIYESRIDPTTIERKISFGYTPITEQMTGVSKNCFISIDSYKNSDFNNNSAPAIHCPQYPPYCLQ